MTIFLDAAPVAVLLTGCAEGAAGTDSRELRHCWQAVLARHGAPVLIGGVPAGNGRAADVQLPWAQPADYTGLVLIRAAAGQADLVSTGADQFIRGFFAVGLPVAASGYATLDLATLDLVRARRVAAPPAARPRLSAAGAIVGDRRVARCDTGPNSLITSASDADLPGFCAAFTSAFRDFLAARPAVALGS
jgi:protease I